MKRKQPFIARPVFLEGARVRLRPLDDRRDVEACVRWMNDQRVREFLSVFAPVTPMQEAEWFANLSKRERDIMLGIETSRGVFIGVMGLHRIDWKNRHAETGTVIGEPRYWGRGYGTEAKLLLLRYAFEELGLHKIHSRAFAFNTRSIRYSLACGYRIEGRLRDFVWSKGRFWDAIELGILRGEWESAMKRRERSPKKKSRGKKR